MTKLKGNRKSKRLKCSLKYNIQKRVNNHNRRLRKEAKKANSGVLGKRKKKDPGIPNNWPFKEQMLQDMAQKKEAQERDIATRRAKQKLEAERERKKMQKESRRNDQDRQIERKKKKAGEVIRAQKLAFQKCLGQADILLEVLDARDPMGSRCPSLEAWALAKEKRVIFVLTKADLVPPESLAGWLSALGRVGPAVATQALAGNKGCLGALLQVLGSVCQTGEKSDRTRFGLVGYSGVGKRTLMKAMRKEAQKAKDADIEMLMRGLLEPIGVLRHPEAGLDANAIAGRTIVGEMPSGNVAEPADLVGHFLTHATPMAMMRLLKLPSFEDVHGLLTAFAEDRKVKSKTGGVAPPDTVAKRVLTELSAKGMFCSPPTTEDLGAQLWAPFGASKQKAEAAMAAGNASLSAATSSSNQETALAKLAVRTGGPGPALDIEALLVAPAEPSLDTDSDDDMSDGEEGESEFDEDGEEEELDDEDMEEDE